MEFSVHVAEYMQIDLCFYVRVLMRSYNIRAPFKLRWFVQSLMVYFSCT